MFAEEAWPAAIAVMEEPEGSAAEFGHGDADARSRPTCDADICSQSDGRLARQRVRFSGMKLRWRKVQSAVKTTNITQV